MSIGLGAFAISLRPTLVGGSVPPAPVAAIDSFEITGFTQLDSVNVSSVDYGIDVEGIAAEVVCDSRSGDPDPTTFTLRIRTPGFVNKVAVWCHTVLRGVALIPKQATSATYVNTPHKLTNAEDGTIPLGKTKFWVLFHYDPDATNALTGVEKGYYVDTVFAESEIVSATVSAGWWDDLAEGAIASPTNASTLSVDDIPIEVTTLNLEREPNDGATRTVRLKVRHLFGSKGRMFDTVSIRGRQVSGGTPTAWTDVQATTAYDPIGDGETYVEIVQGSYSTAGLDDGVMCRDEYLIYPQIGTVPLDGTDYETDPADSRHPQLWRNIRSTAFQRVKAVVQSGASGGTASTDLATATADPFPSWHAAYNAIPAVNNSVNGVNTCDSGLIYGRNTTGSPITLDKSGSLTGTIGEACCEIKQHPDNTAALKFGMGSASHSFPTSMIVDGTEFVRTSTSAVISPTQSRGGTELRVLQLRNVRVNIDHTGGTAPWCSGTWERVNVIGHRMASTTTPGAGASTVGLSGTNAYHCRLVLGLRNETTVKFRVVPYAFYGAKGMFTFFAKGSGQPTQAGMHWASWVDLDTTQTDFGVDSADFPRHGRGYQIETWVQEFGSGNNGIRLSGDGSTQVVDNATVIYAALPPDKDGASVDTARLNTSYCDVAAARGNHKHIRVQLSDFGRYAIKTCWFDFTAEGAGRVQNWRSWLKVGWMFNNLRHNRNPGSYGVAGSGENPEWAGVCAGPGERFNTGLPSVNDNNVGDSGGGGDYRPNDPDDASFATVPIDHQKCTFDLLGATRRNDGTGWAWPYERPAA